MPGFYRRKKYNKNKKNKKKTFNEKVQQVVTKTLSRKVEKKHLDMNPVLYPWTNTLLDNSIPFSAVNLASYYQLQRGDDDGQRTGNSVCFEMCDLCINAATINSNNVGPFIVDIWIGYAKPQQSYPPTETQLRSLLQDGSAATGQNSSTANLLRRVNKDLFTITNHRRFKLGNASYAAAAQSNNDFPMFKNLRIPLSKLLGTMKYNDASAVPSKFLYMWCHATQVNSTTAVATSLPEIRYYLDVEYTDM